MHVVPTKLLGLAVIHVAAGCTAAAVLAAGIAPAAAETFLDALLGAELALLGVWAGFGTHSKPAGFVGVAAGASYFSLLNLMAVWEEAVSATAGVDGYVVLWYLMYFLALALLTLTALVAAAVWMRGRGIRLQAGGKSNEAPAASGEVQFSMRQLMLLVFVAAVLVKLGPAVQSRLNDYRSSTAMLFAVSCWSICFAAVGLAGVWASLGARFSAAKSGLAFVLAAVLSLLPPYYFPTLLTDDFGRSAAALLGAMAILVGSLLVVRQCGFRLARLEK